LLYLAGVAAVSFGIVSGAQAASAATCAPKNSEPVDTVREFYASAMAGDRAKIIAPFDSEGYLFDVGVRYTPAAIADDILKFEAAGTKFEWNVEGSESHVACDLAWATWTTHGTFTTAGKVEPEAELGSAVLVWRDGMWKIRFLHSTKAKASVQ
jgi:hypothetical protein